MARLNRFPVKPTVLPYLESLESRALPAVNFIGVSSGILSIRTDDFPTVVKVEFTLTGVAPVQVERIKVTEGSSRVIGNYIFQEVTRVEFTGGRGDDTFNARGIPFHVQALGNDGHDQLRGGSGTNSLDGGNGNDSIWYTGRGSVYGGMGNDSITTGNGIDYIDAGEGNDGISAQGGNDEVDAGLGDDRIDGGEGNDIIRGGGGVDQINGEGGNDQLEGNDDNDDLFGGAGNDTLNGNGGNDNLRGNDGDDILNGGEGNDYLAGWIGHDFLNGGNGNDTAYGGEGNDTINGWAGEDALNGESGNDILNGGDDNDAIHGEDGNDTINGGGGNDRLVGLAGQDTINGDGGNDTITGGLGADTLHGGDGNDTINGNEDADLITGGAGQDRLLGNAGNDTISGNADADTIDGGSGLDRLDGNLGGDTIDGGTEADTIYGGPDGDTVRGGGGIDTIFGGDGGDSLLGGAGNDVIYGGNGRDSLLGEEGNDTLSGEADDDFINGGIGADILTGGLGKDRLEGSNDNDIIDGGGDADFILGGLGDDTLRGGDGNDTINGNAGLDQLFGGNGDDILIALDDLYTDILQGDGGRDAFWSDATGVIRGGVRQGDVRRDLGAVDVDNFVRAFTFTGMDRTLDGEAIGDPTVTGLGYQRFGDHPLYPANGPTGADIDQGAVPDCMILAAFSALAHNTTSGLAWPIRRAMVDFGDGTVGFALNFGGGVPEFRLRMDADLPVDALGNLVFARLGKEGSLWVPLAEKAIVYLNNWASAAGYLGVPANIPLNYANLDFARRSPRQIFTYFGSADTGRFNCSSFASAQAMADDLFTRWNGYQNVVFGVGDNNFALGIPVNHAYTLWAVNRNPAGQVTSIVLRNPWGVDGGRDQQGYLAYADANPNDALITLTPDQLYATTPGFDEEEGTFYWWGSRIV